MPPNTPDTIALRPFAQIADEPLRRGRVTRPTKPLFERSVAEVMHRQTRPITTVPFNSHRPEHYLP